MSSLRRSGCARSARPRLLTVADDAAVLPGLETLLRRWPGAGRGAHRRGRHSIRPGGVQRLAESLGVADRVVFTGQVSRSQLPALLRSADLFVHTAGYEPTGIVPLQAMACGTAVVATASGAVADAVVDGTTGILVQPGRPALLAQRLRQLLARPMLIEAYGLALPTGSAHATHGPDRSRDHRRLRACLYPRRSRSRSRVIRWGIRVRLPYAG